MIKTIISNISVVLLVLLLFTVRWTTAEQGQGVVFVERPFFFGSGGVEKEIHGTGTYFHFSSTKGTIINLTPVKKSINYQDLATGDKIPVDFSVTITLQLDNKEGYLVVDKFISLDRWHANNFAEPFGEIVRQGARSLKGTDLMYNESVIRQFADEIKNKANKLIAADEHAKVILKSVVVGRANPPESLAKQIEETARQKERKKTELERKIAEDTRADAEKSRAFADKAYRDEMQMSISEYLLSRELDNAQEQIQVMRKAIDEKHANIEFIINSGGQPLQPVRNVGKD